jgi:hypothetical protein
METKIRFSLRQGRKIGFSVIIELDFPFVEQKMRMVSLLISLIQQFELND